MLSDATSVPIDRRNKDFHTHTTYEVSLRVIASQRIHGYIVDESSWKTRVVRWLCESVDWGARPLGLATQLEIVIFFSFLRNLRFNVPGAEATSELEFYSCEELAFVAPDATATPEYFLSRNSGFIVSHVGVTSETTAPPTFAMVV